jgi:hypothetical protein
LEKEMDEIVEHLREPYRVYALHLDPGVNKRPNQAMITVHIGRPVSFKTVCTMFVFLNIELTIEKTNEKIPTNGIIGIQKISNGNKPDYELTLDGTLKELLK